MTISRLEKTVAVPGISRWASFLNAELFPTRVRSTCHAMSAAAGKAGAMVSAFGIQSYTLKGDRTKIKKAMIIMAVTNMFGFFCTFLVIETKAMSFSLEEISGEDGSKDKVEIAFGMVESSE